MYLNDHCREIGNLDQEPVFKQNKNMEKVFGDPKINKGNSKRSLVYDSTGREMTKADIFEQKERFKAQVNYPRNLVLENRQ